MAFLNLRPEKKASQELSAYYYVFNKSELERLKEVINAEVQVIDIDLLAYGIIGDADRFNIMEQVKPVMVIDPTTKRKLQFTIQKNYPENKLRFQFASVFPYTNDVAGVRRDFTLNGKSLYGNPLLLDYMYYECKAKVLEYFLELDTDQKYNYP